MFTPTEIKLQQKSRVLEIAFDDGRTFRLPYGAEPVGSYAIQPTFSDGHATGIYSWDYLYKLGGEQEARWASYLTQVRAAGMGR